MTRVPIIAGNWKMNKTADESKRLIAEMQEQTPGQTTPEIVVCPPFTSLPAAAEALRGSAIKLGAQNIHWAENGAFTGEISAAMLNEIPVQYVIIGHSERRQYFGETDTTVNARLQTALQAGLQPIVCVGETQEEREQDQTEQVVARQIHGGLAALGEADMQTVVVAYEPVWAIGTGLTATPEQAQQVHAFIRSLLQNMFSKQTAEATRILYGGSVKPDNAAELMAQNDIDGALVGGASLKAGDFIGIVNAC